MDFLGLKSVHHHPQKHRPLKNIVPSKTSPSLKTSPSSTFSSSQVVIFVPIQDDYVPPKKTLKKRYKYIYGLV